jgi:acetyl-CoA carboxylase biotin carboxyl carrier protein
MDGNNRKPYDTGSFSGEDADAAGVISIEQLRYLIRLLDHSDVAEVELRRAEAGTRLVLRKVKAPENSGQQTAIPTSSAISPAPLVETNTIHNIVAPLVGIFHKATKPKAKPLVAVGDRVKAGQHVGAIESLNVINEVEAPTAGRIVEILVQEGQPVEYGQQLMTIDSTEGA